MGRKRKADLLRSSGIGGPVAKDARTEDDEDPEQRYSANARERDRMRVLSRAFTKLKTTLPWVPPDTKLSKLDTLKLAACYIAHLRHILSDDNAENSPVMVGIASRKLPNCSPLAPASGSGGGGGGSVHPMALSWPFSFNGRTTGSGDDIFGSCNKSLSNHKYT